MIPAILTLAGLCIGFIALAAIAGASEPFVGMRDDPIYLIALVFMIVAVGLAFAGGRFSI